MQTLGVPVTGWLDREEAVDRLSQATVLLNWSAWDSHPLGVLEAMAFNVLVIGSGIEAEPRPRRAEAGVRERGSGG